MSDLTAAALAAPQLPLDHASLRARRLAAFQTANREGRVQYVETASTFAVTDEPPVAATHIRFDADGTITSIKADGTHNSEKAQARIARGIASDLADTRQLAVWVAHPEIGDGI